MIHCQLVWSYAHRELHREFLHPCLLYLVFPDTEKRQLFGTSAAPGYSMAANRQLVGPNK